MGLPRLKSIISKLCIAMETLVCRLSFLLLDQLFNRPQECTIIFTFSPHREIAKYKHFSATMRILKWDGLKKKIKCKEMTVHTLTHA